MTSTVTALVDTPTVRLGRFRCPPAGSEWQTENSIGPRANVVFPERPVTITRAATGPQLGDRNWAMLYPPGQRYRRQLVDPEGDDCTFVELSRGLYDDLLGADDLAVAAFGAGRVLVGTATWLDYQATLAAADRAERDELPVLDVESRLLTVLTAVLREPVSPRDAAVSVRPRDVRSRGRATRRVNEACRILATHLDERLTISTVADAVGLSAYHFCRQFRAATGLTVHAYRERLRLRQAFATCASTPSRNLSEVALSAGYASHSHMATNFRSSLSMSPSAVRDRYGRGRGEPAIMG